MPKTPRPANAREAQRHNPLAEEYVPSHPFKQKAPKRQKRTREEGDEENYVDSKASRKILEIGRELAEEEEQQNQARRPPVANPAFDFDSRLGEDANDEEPTAQYDDEGWGDEQEEVEEIEIDPNDLATFNKFNPTDDNPIVWPGQETQPSGPGTDLAALILEKIAAHEAENPSQAEDMGHPDDAMELPAKVVEVYSKVGLIMSRYKSGKLPKPFKVLPTIPAWGTLIGVTRPDQWTPNAVYAATRIFISANAATAQEFLNAILLPAVQQDILEAKKDTRKLNVHLYNALKKALYKPAAFFKGIVFPLLVDGACTQKEATIVASVVRDVSVPVLHSAAAINRLCELAAEQMSSDPERAGPVNIFIKTLLDKKYALPYKVVDALVFHFLRFRAVGASNDDAMDTESVAGDLGGVGRLPVIWHQCLLSFAQRYRNDITEDQREALLDLLLTRNHKDITPEIRRELLQGRGRGVVVEPPTVGLDGDDTMVMAVDA
ncbi:Bystin-domain-containing protein [Sporormia fimetaria CBS 119925]|uniref:Bystin-domain-containing protein n=1 Tax=Sporormia fimetaria CBS 119925 TaxID=1340428 RepID=A0A6A6UYY1_9PLEO|nr:Bystin-domain-containing protein [Sporormia fimetaria CBS 119925]